MLSTVQMRVEIPATLPTAEAGPFAPIAIKRWRTVCRDGRSDL